MTDVKLRDLLEAGVHFGHQTQRWNPKMRKYIFLERNGIYIIDLQKSLSLLQRAQKTVREIVSRGGTVLFVGTKKQAKETIARVAEECGQFYVNERWLGGMLTNFQTVRKSLNRFLELEQLQSEATWELLAKKERLRLEKERTKLDRVFHGIKSMTGVPAAMFVVDTVKEKIAVSEAKKLGIPIIGIVDTNSDPDHISHPIPGNDDAIRSIQLLTEAVGSAVKEGSVKARDVREAAEKAEADEKAKGDEAPDSAAAAPAPVSSEE